MFLNKRDILIFSLFWALTSLIASFFYHYYYSHEKFLHLNEELLNIDNSTRTEISYDVKKLEYYLEKISIKIQDLKGKEEINHLLLKYQNVDLHYFHNFEFSTKFSLPIDETTLILQSTAKTNTVYVKLDLIELRQIIHKLIRSDIIISCLQKSGRNQCPKPTSELFSINKIISDLDLVLFFDQGYIKEEFNRIGFQSISLLFALFITGLLNYLIIRLFFLKGILRNELKQSKELYLRHCKLKETNKELQSENLAVRNYQSSNKYERNLMKALQNNIIQVEHYLKLLLKLETSVHQEIYNIEEYFNRVSSQLASISNKIIVENYACDINLAQVIEQATKLLSLKLQLNKINISMKHDNQCVRINIGENALLQIILCLLAFQINALPKNRKIDISILKNQSMLSLSMTDDGFGLTLDMIKSCQNLASQDSAFVLDWDNLEKSIRRQA